MKDDEFWRRVFGRDAGPTTAEILAAVKEGRQHIKSVEYGPDGVTVTRVEFFSHQEYYGPRIEE